MGLQLYNTLSKKKESFKPLEKGKVKFYACGPTVYHYVHIGNLRTFIFEDILRRTLEYSDYSVKYIMNITDVGHLTSDGDTGEDKMLKGARREKKTVWEIAEFYTQAFKDDIAKLNIKNPTKFTKATAHIKAQIAMIKKLEKKGFTYQTGGNVYFDTSKYKKYGSLVNLTKSEQARVEKDKNKKNQHDFVLWFTKSKFIDQEMKWESPWGTGYPGWHIECSAMASKYLGEQFDIHAGGMDLAPVHHTNEIAQAEAAYGKKPWVRYWLHGEFLVLKKGEKMSKSTGDFLTLSVLEEKGIAPLDYRYFTLTGHYRKPLTFSWEALESAKVARKKLQDHYWSLGKSATLSTKAKKYEKNFLEEINDDLNMPKALALVWTLLKDKNISDGEKKNLLDSFDKILGLGLAKAKKSSLKIPKEMKALAEQRLVARKEKDWKKSDTLRDKINAAGFDISDESNGKYLLTKK